jgi:DNA-binding GntR family transcriptional regulator
VRTDGRVGLVDPIEPLANRAYEKLRDAILSNQLQPGERLSVSDLARQMGISRTPVREAVQRLIYDGLAVHVPYRGADVVRVGVDDLLQLFGVREVLDGLAARLACRNLRPGDVEELRQILDDHEEILARDPSTKTHVELDIRYHGRIRALAGNPYLDEMLGRIQGKTHLAVHSLWRGEEARRLALAEHRAILLALSAADPERAERAARTHVAALQRRVPESVAATSPDGASP